MEFDYFNYKSNNKVQKGSIIFSQPLMKDKNFHRSVILICEHNDDGSLGYKLNEKITSINNVEGFTGIITGISSITVGTQTALKFFFRATKNASSLLVGYPILIKDTS